MRWEVWRVIGELAHRDALIERAKAIAAYSYTGSSPTRASLWWQVNDIHTVLLGAGKSVRPKDYAGTDLKVASDGSMAVDVDTDLGRIMRELSGPFATMFRGGLPRPA